MSLSAPSPPALPPTPAAPPPPPVFGMSPVGQKPGPKSTTATFLGSGMVAPGPSSNTYAGKTLLGQ